MEYKTSIGREYFRGQVLFDDGSEVKEDDLFESDGLFTTDYNTVCDLFNIQLEDEEGSISICLEKAEAIKLRDELNKFIDQCEEE